MKEKKINCYLCSTDKALELSEYIDDDPLKRSIMVECPVCKKYELDDGAQRFWFKRPDGKKLSPGCQDRVKKYIKEERKNNPEKYKEKPVKITKDIMKDLCPEESIHYNY